MFEIIIAINIGFTIALIIQCSFQQTKINALERRVKLAEDTMFDLRSKLSKTREDFIYSEYDKTSSE